MIAPIREIEPADRETQSAWREARRFVATFLPSIGVASEGPLVAAWKAWLWAAWIGFVGLAFAAGMLGLLG